MTPRVHCQHCHADIPRPIGGARLPYYLCAACVALMRKLWRAA